MISQTAFAMIILLTSGRSAVRTCSDGKDSLYSCTGQRPKNDGPLVVNEPEMAFHAALDGLGMPYVLEDRAAPLLASGRRVRMMEDGRRRFQDSSYTIRHAGR